MSLPLLGWAQTTLTSKANTSPTNYLLEGTYVGTDGKPYEPLTDAQVQAWLKSVTPEVLFFNIRKLDLIEHVTPIIGFPEAVVGTEKNGNIFLAWTDPAKLTIDVAGQLNYSIPLDAKEFKGIVKKDSTLKVIISLLLSAAVAGFSEYLFDQVGITKSGGVIVPVVAVGLGTASGGLLFALWPQE